MKLIINLLQIIIFTASLSAQSITNTLGTGGFFILKYGINTEYLNLSQSDSIMTINYKISIQPTISSGVGVIYKGNQRFLHDFRPPGAYGGNTFLGIDAGNFTMNGTSTQSSYNTGMGKLSLNRITTGSNNTAVGFLSLYNNTSGNNNSAFGFNALTGNTTGSNNSAFGYNSLYGSSTGNDNSAFGNYSLFNNGTGNCNSAFGSYSLNNNYSGNNNSAFGYKSLYSNSDGVGNSAFGYNSLYSE